MSALRRFRNLLATALTASFAASGCGGGTPEASTAEHAADDAHSTKADRDSDGAPDESESEEAAPAHKAAACDDGTCTLCGDSQCPIGWYCDESAKGGPSCGWLPECAKKPTCACVKRALSGSCEERSGGVYVKHD